MTARAPSLTAGHCLAAGTPSPWPGVTRSRHPSGGVSGVSALPDRSRPVEQLLALALGQAAPDAVRLAARQCVVQALAAHGAVPADLLGRGLASAPGRLALAVRVEEQVVPPAAAGGE